MTSLLAGYLEPGEIQGEILKLQFLEKSDLNHVITYISNLREIYRGVVSTDLTISSYYNPETWTVNKEDRVYVYGLLLIHNQMYESLLNALVNDLNNLKYQNESEYVFGRDNWEVLNTLLNQRPLADTVRPALILMFGLISFVIKLAKLYLEEYSEIDQEKLNSLIIELEKRHQFYERWKIYIEPSTGVACGKLHLRL